MLIDHVIFSKVISRYTISIAVALTLLSCYHETRQLLCLLWRLLECPESQFSSTQGGFWGALVPAGAWRFHSCGQLYPQSRHKETLPVFQFPTIGCRVSWEEDQVHCSTR